MNVWVVALDEEDRVEEMEDVDALGRRVVVGWKVPSVFAIKSSSSSSACEVRDPCCAADAKVNGVAACLCGSTS